MFEKDQRCIDQQSTLFNRKTFLFPRRSTINHLQLAVERL